MTVTVKTHPLQSISESGAQPLARAVALRGGNVHSDVMAGMLAGQEIIGIIKAHARDYTTLCHRLWNLTTEGRTQAIKTLREWIAQCKKDNADMPGMDKKATARLINSATTRASELSTVAKAMDSGMVKASVAGIMQCTEDEVVNVGHDKMVSIARTFVKSDARGRKPDPFMVAFGKWLLKNKPEADKTGDLADYNAVAEFFERYDADLKRAQ